MSFLDWHAVTFPIWHSWIEPRKPKESICGPCVDIGRPECEARWRNMMSMAVILSDPVNIRYAS